MGRTGEQQVERLDHSRESYVYHPTSTAEASPCGCVPVQGRVVWGGRSRGCTCSYSFWEYGSPHTLHPAPYTLHPPPYTIHPTPYTSCPAGAPPCECVPVQSRVLWGRRQVFYAPLFLHFEPSLDALNGRPDVISSIRILCSWSIDVCTSKIHFRNNLPRLNIYGEDG